MFGKKEERMSAPLSYSWSDSNRHFTGFEAVTSAVGLQELEGQFIVHYPGLLQSFYARGQCPLQPFIYTGCYLLAESQGLEP